MRRLVAMQTKAAAEAMAYDAMLPESLCFSLNRNEPCFTKGTRPTLPVARGELAMSSFIRE